MSAIRYPRLLNPDDGKQWRVERRGDYYYVALYEGSKRLYGENLAFIYRYEAVEYANKLNKANKHPLTNKSGRKRNCGPDGVERDKWIPAHAVRFNKDGSVSMMR